MDVDAWLAAAYRESEIRGYFSHVDVLDLGRAILKARLHISSDLFVQVYRNDLFDTTNLVLVYGGRRLYGRDQLGGRWHRHALEAPDVHDVSNEGRRSVDLSAFLDEVEIVLTMLDLL